MSSRRLFVALRPPEHIAEALLDMQEGIPGARWQDADNLHVTLRFVGEVDRHTAAVLECALADVHFAPFPLAISGVGHFEGNRRAKAIWARIAPSAALDELQMRVEMACRRAGLPAETRKFVPHITLARLNSGSGPIGDWLHEHGACSLGAWRVDRFSLYESDLTPNGAIYSEVTTFP
ncbi:RNA 2',3'-cyclic phosphodiesterase [Aurantiacibacter poecillastricola]|uniref:RNA 2',3'-cyclic phosphodiesterase n=1 Tax=Aurantiacibacter poecillastricola TaxID=3064385 RepID=UPI00273CFEA7|nr:RNA 2',3'-cyclic phosphodiesterase [Aurantiacibacter sp. 219JJ12-13]MDP5261656.1 RNA 2',3'-cyclic phosphodiesterase [Aurantiacibacter sp. 219JJ12-13]